MGDSAVDGDSGFWGHARAMLEADVIYYGSQVASLVIATIAGGALSPWKWDRPHSIWIAVLLVVGCVPFVSAALRANTAKTVVNQQAELVQMLRAYVSPSLTLLQRSLAEGHEPTAQRAFGGVLHAVATSAQRICGPSADSVRCLVFEARSRSGRTLEVSARSGGTEESSRKFSKDRRDAGGSHVWEVAETGEPMLYPDVESDPPPGFDTSTRHKYKTFITCGVLGSDGRVFGMINVDSQSPGDLTPVDAEVVGFLAQVLGVAFEARELRSALGA